MASIIQKYVYIAAKSSTVYAQNWVGAYPGVWGPDFATNLALSYNQFYIFHSAYEPYPWLIVTLGTLTGTLTAVRMQTRCDANQWFHYQNIEFRSISGAALTAIPGALLTTGTLCGNLAMTLGWQCGAYTLTCAATMANVQEVSVQQDPSHLRG